MFIIFIKSLFFKLFYIFTLSSLLGYSALGESRSLQDFLISIEAKKHNIKVKGQKALLSQFSSLLSSQNVIIEIENKALKETMQYYCSSFTFEITDSFITCEIEEKHKVLTISSTTSNIRFFPINP